MLRFSCRTLSGLFESLWRNTFYLTYPTLDILDKTVPLGLNVVVPVKSLLVIFTALLTLAALHLFVNRTRMGTAIRAVAQDPDTASLMGIPVNRVIALTFFVGGAMGGLAGVLFGLHYSLVNPYSGFFPGLKAFTAAVLGGIGNIPGAMLGGMVLGLLEAFAASYLSILTDGAFGAEYKDVFAFARTHRDSYFSSEGTSRGEGAGGGSVRAGWAHLGVVGYIAASSALAFAFPRSVLAFLLFEASLLVIYYAPLSRSGEILLGRRGFAGAIAAAGFR